MQLPFVFLLYRYWILYIRPEWATKVFRNIILNTLPHSHFSCSLNTLAHLHFFLSFFLWVKDDHLPKKPTSQMNWTFQLISNDWLEHTVASAKVFRLCSRQHTHIFHSGEQRPWAMSSNLPITFNPPRPSGHLIHGLLHQELIIRYSTSSTPFIHIPRRCSIHRGRGTEDTKQIVREEQKIKITVFPPFRGTMRPFSGLEGLPIVRAPPSVPLMPWSAFVIVSFFVAVYHEFFWPPTDVCGFKEENDHRCGKSICYCWQTMRVRGLCAHGG